MERREAWSRIEFTDADPMELSSGDREGLLELMRDAGRQEQYEVRLDVNQAQQDLLQTIQWNQDGYRFFGLLEDAFGDDYEGRHHWSSSWILGGGQPSEYTMLVYNLAHKPEQGGGE
tara:strand:- start:2256 stop:2606 length:351 start_codon:yes stop_codon:yes gene_type:complete